MLNTFLYAALAFGTPRDSGVEIRLELIQETRGREARELALGVEIINHTSRDVYVPGLHPFEVLLYGDQDGVFVQDSLDDPREDFAPPMFTEKTNTIFAYFPDRSDLLWHSKDDSLLSAYCKAKGYSLGEWNNWRRKPLFLRAHEVYHFELSRFRIIGLDHIMDDHTEFKFVFHPVRVADKYRPRQILGYRRVDQDQLQSNALYYQTLPFLRGQ